MGARSSSALVAGDWADDFLVLQPGEHVTMTYDEGVIGCGVK